MHSGSSVLFIAERAQWKEGLSFRFDALAIMGQSSGPEDCPQEHIRYDYDSGCHRFGVSCL
jgi:hypothetical protein